MSLQPLPNQRAVRPTLYNTLPVRFLYGQEMQVVCMFSLYYSNYNQPVIVCDCCKFSHSLIGMLNHECQRKAMF
jgi:hypothetical protein